MSDTDMTTPDRADETSTIGLEGTRAETAQTLGRLQGINAAVDELTQRLVVRAWSGDELLTYLQLCRDEREALRSSRLSRHWYDVERLRIRRSRSASNASTTAGVNWLPRSGTVA